MTQIAPVGATAIPVESLSGISTLDTLTLTHAADTPIANLTIASVGSTTVTIGSGSTVATAIVAGTAVTFSRLVTIGGTETAIDYQENDRSASFTSSDTIYISNTVDLKIVVPYYGSLNHSYIFVMLEHLYNLLTSVHSVL